MEWHQESTNLTEITPIYESNSHKKSIANWRFEVLYIVILSLLFHLD